MSLVKMIVTMATYLATLLIAILLVSSIFVFQPAGMFWYGLGLIVSGVALRTEVKFWV